MNGRSTLNSNLGSITGIGRTKKGAAENYIRNLELHENVVHTFVQRVKELTKEEFSNLEIKGE